MKAEIFEGNFGDLLEHILNTHRGPSYKTDGIDIFMPDGAVREFRVGENNVAEINVCDCEQAEIWIKYESGNVRVYNGLNKYVVFGTPSNGTRERSRTRQAEPSKQ